MNKMKKAGCLILLTGFCMASLLFSQSAKTESVLAAGLEDFMSPFEGLIIPPFDTGNTDNTDNTGNTGNTQDNASGTESTEGGGADAGKPKTLKEKEPNDDVSMANKVKVGKTITGTMGQNNDIDIYQFTLSKASYINVSLTHTPMNVSGNMWFVYLRNSKGKLVNRTTDHLFSSTDNEYAESKPVKLKKGTYYATVVGYASAVGQEYALTVNRITAKTPMIKTADSAGYRGITLSWEAVPGASDYHIYRSTSKSGGYKKVASLNKVKETKWTDENLSTGKQYYYKMKAVVSTDKKSTSGFSNTVSAKPVPGTAGLITFVDEKDITLRWSKVAGADGYEIVRSTKASGAYKKIKTISKGKVTSYTDMKKKSGKTYYYKIRAYRRVNGKTIYGSYSNIAFGIVSKTNEPK